MFDPETGACADLEAELAHLQREVTGATQLYFTWRQVGRSTESRLALRALNRAPLFWLTTQAALQMSIVTVLARIFDSKSDARRVDSFIDIVEANKGAFRRDALRARKRPKDGSSADWLDAFVANAHVPSTDEIKTLSRHTAEKRYEFETTIQPLRHNVVAHAARIGDAERNQIFAAASLASIEALLAYLHVLYVDVRGLYENGTKCALFAKDLASLDFMTLARLSDSYASLPEDMAVQTKSVIDAQIAVNAFTKPSTR